MDLSVGVCGSMALSTYQISTLEMLRMQPLYSIHSLQSASSHGGIGIVGAPS